MPHLTLGWLTLIGASAADVITAAAETGFRSVSIRITGRKPDDGFPMIVGNGEKMREIRKRLDDTGLRLSNTSIYHLSPSITMDDVQPAIDATVELGANIIVATCTDPDHDRWVAFMARYAEAARAAGITLAFEFVPFSEARTIEVAADLIRRTGAPNFGFLVDSLHLSRSGRQAVRYREGRSEADRVRATLRRGRADSARDQLANEARTGRKFPGQGALPLYDFLDALPPGVEIEIEIPVQENAALGPVEQARRAGDATRAFLRSTAPRAASRPGSE
jgi:sugar phosphate isomerase/epimerase